MAHELFLCKVQMAQILRRAMKLPMAQLVAAEAAEVAGTEKTKLKDINAVLVTRRMPGTMDAPDMPGMPNEKPVIRMEKTVVPHSVADNGTDGAARVKLRQGPKKVFSLSAKVLLSF